MKVIKTESITMKNLEDKAEKGRSAQVQDNTMGRKKAAGSKKPISYDLDF